MEGLRLKGLRVHLRVVWPLKRGPLFYPSRPRSNLGIKKGTLLGRGDYKGTPSPEKKIRAYTLNPKP